MLQVERLQVTNIKGRRMSWYLCGDEGHCSWRSQGDIGYRKGHPCERWRKQDQGIFGMEETKAEAMFQSLWYMSGSDKNNKEGMEERNFRGMSFEGRRIFIGNWSNVEWANANNYLAPNCAPGSVLGDLYLLNSFHSHLWGKYYHYTYFTVWKLRLWNV